MNKGESKYFHTASLMDEALIVLLEKKKYEYITIKEVCLKAGVHRSTFYLHYETMEDLLLESVLYIENKWKSQFKEDDLINRDYIEHCPIEKLQLITPQYLIPYLKFVKEHKKIFIAATAQPGVFKIRESFQKLYDEIFEPILIRFHIPDHERKYKITYYLNGMFAVIMLWIKEDCQEEVNEIARILMDCLKEWNNDFEKENQQILK